MRRLHHKLRRLWLRFLDWLVPGDTTYLGQAIVEESDGDLLTGDYGVRRDVLPEMPGPKAPILRDARDDGAR